MSLTSTFTLYPGPILINKFWPFILIKISKYFPLILSFKTITKSMRNFWNLLSSRKLTLANWYQPAKINLVTSCLVWLSKISIQEITQYQSSNPINPDRYSWWKISIFITLWRIWKTRQKWLSDLIWGFTRMDILT